MKLPDFIQFEPFNRLRERMRAALPQDLSISQPIDRLTLADLEILASKGLDVEINEVQELSDGTLVYKDRRVLLHIRDIVTYQNREAQESLPKFHVANCRKLQEMRAKNRFDRYVVSTRTDGKFSVIFIQNFGKNRPETCALKICKLCLEHLSYKDYRISRSLREKIYESFSIDEYFSAYPPRLMPSLPTYTDATAPLNDYGPDFGKISTQYRSQKDWICEKCKVDLSAPVHHEYLHTHHRNGLKYDNREDNLEALCLRCHAEEPMHLHVKNSPAYQQFIAIYPSLRQSYRKVA